MLVSIDNTEFPVREIHGKLHSHNPLRKSEQLFSQPKLQDGGIREEDGEEGASTCSDEDKNEPAKGATGAPSTAGKKKLQLNWSAGRAS